MNALNGIPGYMAGHEIRKKMVLGRANKRPFTALKGVYKLCTQKKSYHLSFGKKSCLEALCELWPENMT